MNSDARILGNVLNFHLCCSDVHAGLSQVLQNKERRAQQQLERSSEERGRKMEDQRRKEQQRRAAAEEKRRHQQEAEKVRGHDTLMMHSMPSEEVRKQDDDPVF